MSILIECRQDTRNVTLHTNDIIIYNESVTLVDDKQLSSDIFNLSVDTKLQFFIIFLNDGLKQGKQYKLSIKFRGNLNEDLAGFYRSSYRDDNGLKRQELLIDNWWLVISYLYLLTIRQLLTTS